MFRRARSAAHTGYFWRAKSNQKRSPGARAAKRGFPVILARYGAALTGHPCPFARARSPDRAPAGRPCSLRCSARATGLRTYRRRPDSSVPVDGAECAAPAGRSPRSGTGRGSAPSRLAVQGCAVSRAPRASRTRRAAAREGDEAAAVPSGSFIKLAIPGAPFLFAPFLWARKEKGPSARGTRPLNLMPPEAAQRLKRGIPARPSRTWRRHS